MLNDQFIKDRLQNIEHFSYHSLINIQKMADIMYYEVSQARRNTSKNPLVKAGMKCFSQTDEDGITLEIISRINPTNKTYLEFGCGNGLENNTLILAAAGWNGAWVGGEEIAWNLSVAKDRLLFLKEWITLENIPTILKTVTDRLGIVDVVSLDLDGNDLHFAKCILENNIKPVLFIVEYNSKYPPEIIHTIPYNASHNWVDDDYFGASLGAFNLLFKRHDYSLVACNSQTGANAFFVNNQYISKFLDCPKDLRELYEPPRYYLYNKYGHRSSPKTIESIFQQPKI